MRYDGSDNLIPANERSQDELREMTRNGGIKSGETRRRKKMMREQLEMLLSLPVNNATVIQRCKEMGISEEEIDWQMALTTQIVKRAMSGDVKAYEVIRDTIGEKPIEQIKTLDPPVIKLERPDSDG